MKRSIILLLVLSMSGTLSAQTQPAMQERPHTGSIMAKPESYLYAELIGSHLPSHKGEGVIFDFGQATKAWSYNWITDEKGRKIRFDSVVEALNYMIRQRWEFVQAYTSGTENDYTHYLLRIRTENIPSRLRSKLPPVPDGSETDAVKGDAAPVPASAE